jgi:hypothetical protein
MYGGLARTQLRFVKVIDFHRCSSVALLGRRGLLLFTSHYGDER